MVSIAMRLLVLVSFFDVAAGSESFHYIATKLERTFDETGRCNEGSIKLILEGSSSPCSAFSNINDALTETNGDFLPASRKILVDSVSFGEEFSELDPIQFIDEHNENYTFTETADVDLYGCRVQTIERVNSDGAALHTVVGKRSTPDCIDKMIFEVIEVKEKFETMGETETDGPGDFEEETEGIVVSQTLPPVPKGEALHVTAGLSRNDATLVIAFCTVAIAVALPFLVFYFYYMRKTKTIPPPTDASEWLEMSRHAEEGNPDQLV